MVNNRTFYAVKQLSIKSNDYSNSSVVVDALQVDTSGDFSSSVTEITILDNASFR